MADAVPSWKGVLAVGLYCAYAVASCLHNYQYASIAPIAARYYGATLPEINWASQIFSLSYVLLVFPSTWVLDRFGVRKGVLVGIFLTLVSAWLKVGLVSVIHSENFLPVLGAQLLASIGQIFVLGLPPRLAALWFLPRTQGKACGFATVGYQMGWMLSLGVPPLMVLDGPPDTVREGMFKMHLTYAIFATFVMVAAFVGFEEKAAPREEEEPEHYCVSIRNLFSNRQYRLLFVAFGIHVGVAIALTALLNLALVDIYSENYAEMMTTVTSLVTFTMGMLGSVIVGLILDRTRWFHESPVFLSGLQALIFLGLSFSFIYPTGIVSIIMVGMFGFTLNGYVVSAYEQGVELTYPASQVTMSSVLNGLSQAVGLGLITLSDWTLEKEGAAWMASSFSACLLLSTILQALIKPMNRRQDSIQFRTLEQVIP